MRRFNVQRLPFEAPKAFALCLALIITAWFLAQSWRGLTVFFTGDDIMNIYWSCEASWTRLLTANLTPFTTEYRPLGALLYRALFETFGLNPLPFRLLFYSLMLANTFLCFQLARLLTRSTEVALLAALMASFHNRFLDLYLNNGTIYDVLCATFYLAALCLYISVRRDGNALTLPQWTLLLILEIAALNSKEIAATLPAMLIAYELLLNKRPIRYFGLATSLAIAAVAAWARFQPGSRLLHNDGYALHLTLHQYLNTSRKFLENLFYLNESSLTTTKTAIFLLGLLLLAFLTRSLALRFCLLFVLIAPLPVNFIVERELYAAYLTVLGWAILLSVILVGTRDWMYAHLWSRQTAEGTFEPERFFLALTVAAVLFTAKSKDRPIPWANAQCPNNQVCAFRDQMQSLVPAPGSILLLSVPVIGWLAVFKPF